MNPFLARTLFIPAIYKYWKTPVFHYYNKYMSNEHVSIEELKQYQKDKLAEILNYAANKTEYYKDALSKNNLEIADYSADALLSKLPILTKQIIQNEGSRLYSDDYISTGFTTEHSGGSTGQPTAVRKDLKTRAAVHAATWRANCWTGWKLGESWTWL